MFDRICQENGIRHLLTAPCSPTTTGKIERFHKTLRAEFLTGHDRAHATVEELQAAVRMGRRVQHRPAASVLRWPAAGRTVALAEKGIVATQPDVTSRPVRSPSPGALMGCRGG
jgi:transposase InsO family protein